MINSLEEAIKHCEEVAEKLEKQVTPYQCESINKKLYEVNKKEWDSCIECAKDHRQLAEWLKELKAYKELDTYNRPNKCSECEFEDSAYYCDDCIWNNVNKFKQKEVKADGDSN